MKKFNKIILFFTLISLISCNLDLQENPNAPSPYNLDADYTLNQIQVDFKNFFVEATEPTAEAVRLEYMFDTYEVNYISSNANLQNAWRIAYADLLVDINTLVTSSEENGLLKHAGIARTLKAYVMLTMVDMFGDVPYSEALLGQEQLFPHVDSGSDIYDLALEELNQALTNFNAINNGTPNVANDLFFNNNYSKWIKLANTIKLKYYLNKGMGSDFGTVVASGNIISSSSDNFLWRAGSADENSQHLYYVEEYMAASPGEYIPNYLIWTMTEEKGVDDPRLRYYFYRQVNSFPTDPLVLDIVIDCWNDPRPNTYDAVDPQLPFCALFERGDGYWGRDHSNNEGIPPDNTFRTTFGVYPVGGRFDDNDAQPINAGDGLNGAGIWPIMMDSFVYFMRAEAALTLDTSDDPREMLEQGVRASIARVMNFLPNPDNFDHIPSQADVNDYVDLVLSIYDNVGTDDEKLAVIGKEYFIDLFGNGIEAYNLYRRTGTPTNLQPTYLGTGTFPRSFYYPNNSVDANTNIHQKTTFANQVFWDTKPAGFIQ